MRASLGAQPSDVTLTELDGGRVGYQAGIPTGAVFSFDLPGYFDPGGYIGVPAVLTPTEAGLGFAAP